MPDSTNDELLSHCHKAPIVTISADEGTAFWQCSECKRPCNIAADKDSKVHDFVGFGVDELREALDNLREDSIEYGESLYHGRVKSQEDYAADAEALVAQQMNIMQLITADRKHELQTRIDELIRERKNGYWPYRSDEADSYNTDRIAELKQELEKL